MLTPPAMAAAPRVSAAARAVGDCVDSFRGLRHARSLAIAADVHSATDCEAQAAYGAIRRWARPCAEMESDGVERAVFGPPSAAIDLARHHRRITIWTGVHYIAAPVPVTGVKVTPLEVIIEHGWYAIGLLTLMVGVQASSAVSGEREQVTWDGLLASPMTFREILHGKLARHLGRRLAVFDHLSLG